MKRLLIILTLLAPIVLMGQSNMKRGMRVGNTDNEILIDSIIEVAGATRIFYNGVAYDAINPDSLGAAEVISAGDAAVVYVGGSFQRTSQAALTADVRSDVSTNQADIAALEAADAAQAAANQFDTLIVSDDNTEVYLYVTTPSGQIRVTLDVDSRTDLTPPTFVSGLVTGTADTIITLTMSEWILGDSILEYTAGGGGGNWSGINSAYQMNEASGLMADAVGSDNGTITESPAGSLQGDSTGVSSFGYYFDGTNDYVTITGKDHAADDISMAAWVFPHDLTADGSFIGGEDGALFWQYDGPTGGLRLGRVTDQLTTTTALTLTVNTWNHIAFAYDQGANTVDFYINGTKETEAFTTTFTAATQYVGARKAGVSGYFNGLIDDFFIWEDVVITENTVDSIWNTGIPGRRYNESGGSLLSNTDTISNAFTVTVDGVGVGVDTVYTLGSTVTLDLDTQVGWAVPVTVAYDLPTGSGAARGLRDSSNNYTIDRAAFSITNTVDTAANRTVYQTWDFEEPGAYLGTFPTDSMSAYLGTLDHSDYNTAPSIVVDTINGAATQVLRVINEVGFPTEAWLYSGLDVAWDLSAGYDEIYYSFNMKIGEDAISVPDMKLPGLEPTPSPNTNIPSPGFGFRAQVYAQRGFEGNSYIYDRTIAYPAVQGSNPHDAQTPALDSVYFVPNVWYNITIRGKKNDFSGSTPLANGIFEWARDGRWMNQVTGLRLLEDAGAQIDGISIRNYTGGNGTANRPIRTFYVYFDNLNVWRPNNDITWGTTDVHTVDITAPDDITDRTFTPDETIVIEQALANSEYPTAYSAALEEQYLLDAGAGNTVTFTFGSGSVIGSNDFLFLYDGNASDDFIITKYTGQSITTATSFTSSGRYMFIRFASWNQGGGAAGWNGNITHNP